MCLVIYIITSKKLSWPPGQINKLLAMLTNLITSQEKSSILINRAAETATDRTKN